MSWGRSGYQWFVDQLDRESSSHWVRTNSECFGGCSGSSEYRPRVHLEKVWWQEGHLLLVYVDHPSSWTAASMVVFARHPYCYSLPSTRLPRGSSPDSIWKDHPRIRLVALQESLCAGHRYRKALAFFFLFQELPSRVPLIQVSHDQRPPSTELVSSSSCRSTRASPFHLDRSSPGLQPWVRRGSCFLRLSYLSSYF